MIFEHNVVLYGESEAYMYEIELYVYATELWCLFFKKKVNPVFKVSEYSQHDTYK